jgi:hypothetical protein
LLSIPGTIQKVKVLRDFRHDLVSRLAKRFDFAY